MNFEDILSETESSNGGPRVISQVDDFDAINAIAGLEDPAEMLCCTAGLVPWSEVETVRKLVDNNQWDEIERRFPGSREAIANYIQSLKDDTDLRDRAIARADLARGTGGQIGYVQSEARNGETAAWHELGTTVDRDMTADQANRLVGGDYPVTLWPVRFQFGDESREFPGRFVIGRGDTGDAFGVVGRRYEPVQNGEIFEMLSKVVGDIGGHIVSAGITQGGASVFAVSRHNGVFEPVAGDAVESYTLATASHRGDGCLRFLSTSRRVCCENTRTNALTEGRGNGLSIRHTKNCRSTFAAAVNALRQSETAFHRFAESAAAMVATPIGDQSARMYLDDLLDVTLDVTAAEAKTGSDALAAALDCTEAERRRQYLSFERKIKHRSECLDDILTRMESSTNTARGTVWGVYNSATESGEHGPILKTRSIDSDDVAKRRDARERRFESVLTGPIHDFESAAFESAMAVVNSR